MLHKVNTIGALLFITSIFSTSVLALDLQREELLNLYHGIEGEQSDLSNQLVNMSSGFIPIQQANEHDEIQFTPLPNDQALTTIGVFTSDSLHEELSSRREYEFKTPTQFGHNESESVGVFIKQTF